MSERIVAATVLGVCVVALFAGLCHGCYKTGVCHGRGGERFVGGKCWAASAEIPLP